MIPPRPIHNISISFALGLLLSVSDAAGQSDVPAEQADPPGTGAEQNRRWRDPEKVHDPSTIVTESGVRRFFGTGRGVTLYRESTEGAWLPEDRVFREGELPAWHNEAVPGNRGHLWAPDVIRIGDAYFVYYSVSTFGKNTSAIGLAVGATLDPTSPDWAWEDRGTVVVSSRGDRFNAIDPALFRDPADGKLWMSFGSFWDGIFLLELDPDSGMPLVPGAAPELMASTPEIEAPFIHKKDGEYFLFINWGRCCRGTNSTYEIRVGRSDKASGPYLDRDGKDLREGGGTLVLGSEGRWIGPGHASIHEQDGREFLVHHYYDGELGGSSRMRMVDLVWDDEGWPVAVPPGDG